eukprot:m.22331 g.22331  ORF g.22331 m.22331 type:complete len:669 (-) comp5449_c1_seq1:844-2850(-)
MSSPRDMFDDGSVPKDLKKQYKAEREKYEVEKQRIKERTGYDATLSVMKSGHLKVRNQLRSWVKFYCELKHGMLIMYKDDKPDVWMDTIILAGGVVIERPSRKEGFTFKFSHPLKQSVHSPRGPKGEIFLNLVRVPSDHCIFRVSTASECKDWMNAFKLAIFGEHPNFNELMEDQNMDTDHDHDDLIRMNSMEYLTPDITTTEKGAVRWVAAIVPDISVKKGIESQKFKLPETDRTSIAHKLTKLSSGNDFQIPPTLYHPSSLLERLSDLFLHANILSQTALAETSELRMRGVCKWFFSCFYSKFEKFGCPYPPLPGEIFRCKFSNTEDQDENSIQFNAEVVIGSPLTCVFDCVCQDGGWAVTGNVKPKYQLFGNSFKYSLVGSLTLTFAASMESYKVELPSIRAMGLILGNITTGLCGKPTITCTCANLSCAIDFDVGTIEHNLVSGVLSNGTNLVCSFSGNWDDTIKCNTNEVLFNADESFEQRTMKFVLERPFLYPFNSKHYSGTTDSQSVWDPLTASAATTQSSRLHQQFAEIEKARASVKETKPHLFEKHGKGWVFNIARAEELFSETPMPNEVTVLRNRSVLSRNEPMDHLADSQFLLDDYQSRPQTAMAYGRNGFENEALSMMKDRTSSLEQRMLAMEISLARERLVFLTILVVLLLIHFF